MENKDTKNSFYSLKNAQDLSNYDIDIVNFFSDLPSRTRKEEIINSFSHAIFAILSIPAFFYLLYVSFYSTKNYAVISAFFYGLSLMMLFSSSAIYHYTDNILTKKKFRIIDHCAIFVFIVGNYSPLLLLTVGGTVGWSMLMTLCIAAIIGIFLKIRFTGSYDWFFVLLYVLMAWIGVFQGNHLANNLPSAGFNLLLFGGAAYMIGIIFYKAEGKLPYAHFIWHIFVAIGAATHYFAIVNFIFA